MREAAGTRSWRGFLGYHKDFGFYSKWNGKSWEVLSRKVTWSDLDLKSINLACCMDVLFCGNRESSLGGLLQ